VWELRVDVYGSLMVGVLSLFHGPTYVNGIARCAVRGILSIVVRTVYSKMYMIEPKDI